MGYSGVVNFGGARIGGFSGIFKSYDFFKGHFEKPPYDQNTSRSAFHVKQYELWKLQQVRGNLDVLMSHDWPDGITKFGDEADLLQQKPFYAPQIDDGSLGCKYYTELMKQHKPKWWLSGHMHVFFEGDVTYENDPATTKFVACTKAVPYTNFLHVISINPSTPGQPKQLFYDPEWLGILRAMENYFPLTKVYNVPKVFDYSIVETAIKTVQEEVVPKGLVIPENFTVTVTPHWSDKKSGKPTHRQHVNDLDNIQTTQFREWLGLSSVNVKDNIQPSSRPPTSPRGFNDQNNRGKKRLQHFE